MPKDSAILQITESLKKLPDDKLQVVYDFVSYLLEREQNSDLLFTMLTSESSLKNDWDRPEENAAWADL